RVDKPTPNSLSLLGAIDIHNLRLEQSGDMRKGAFGIYVIEQDVSGKVLREVTNTIGLNLTGKQYADCLKSGVFFRQLLKPEAGVATLRVLVQYPRSTQVGSLIIPLSQIH
ncbi:MAG: hypothetical protein ACRD33_07870, partial [Candidatus Acidiferrales bacterium]